MSCDTVQAQYYTGFNTWFRLSKFSHLSLSFFIEQQQSNKLLRFLVHKVYIYIYILQRPSENSQLHGRTFDARLLIGNQ